METEVILNEETLDPEDWEAMRILGHQMVDDLLEQLADIHYRPVWQHASETVKTHFDGGPPLDPQDRVVGHLPAVVRIPPRASGPGQPSAGARSDLPSASGNDS